MDNHADQINYIGEEIYAHVAVRDPQRAGKITGMILELDDITELLYMLETPELFNSMIADCVRVIEQPV
jgi:polyadenylate-binding protein